MKKQTVVLPFLVLGALIGSSVAQQATTPSTTALSGNLSGQTYNAGGYAAPGPLTLSSSVTLNGQGNPNAVFIFQLDSTLTTSAGSSVRLINGAQPSRVFWQVDGAYWRRHALKPGITGLAQVRGFRGATHRQSDLESRLQADLEYVSGWSLWRRSMMPCALYCGFCVRAASRFR